MPQQKGTGWKQNFGRKKTPQERKKEREASLDTAFEAVGEGGKASVKELSEYLGVSEKTVRRRLEEAKKYWISEGEAGINKRNLFISSAKTAKNHPNSMYFNYRDRDKDSCPSSLTL